MTLTFLRFFHSLINLICPSLEDLQNDTFKGHGQICSTYGREEECIQDFGGRARRKETTSKTPTKVGGY
jgi:hypothetical protein